MKRALLLLALGTLVAAGALQALVTRPVSLPAQASDGCVRCHANVEGLEASHATLGCQQCHLGNAATQVPSLAHAGLVRIPGNLADAERTCGASGCHADVPHRVKTSLMNTMNGVVSVDRWVFGEQPTPTATTPVASLGHSPADTHLRNLCASCHLGNPKTAAGPLDETSRGGGCNACHLAYSPQAEASLGQGKDPAKRFVHAQLRVRPEPIACFGCHARSGRVSLNYEGWQEFSGDAGAPTQELADGRVVRRGTPDVHFERGLGCVDCHGSWEVMGDGTTPLHREDQSTLRCTDCHLVGAPVTKALEDFDGESRRVAELEGFATPGRRSLVIARSGVPLVNTFVSDGGAFLTGKYTGRTAPLRPPAKACTGPAHARLSCGSCHEAWVPQCVSCHTRFEPDAGMYDLLANAEAPGAWLEAGGAPLAEPASLGVRELADGGVRIEEFAPGMIMTLARADAGTSFHRLFAPVFAHTVRREVRACAGCHVDSLALGYGRGVLRYDAKAKRWAFTPARPTRAEDGLPEDAWVGFRATRGVESTTREDTRPLSVAEQERVLAVGACLACHPEGSPELARALDDFAAARH